jgi:hypothetical protein
MPTPRPRAVFSWPWPEMPIVRPQFGLPAHHSVDLDRSLLILVGQGAVRTACRPLLGSANNRPSRQGLATPKTGGASANCLRGANHSLVGRIASSGPRVPPGALTGLTCQNSRHNFHWPWAVTSFWTQAPFFRFPGPCQQLKSRCPTLGYKMVFAHGPSTGGQDA